MIVNTVKSILISLVAALVIGAFVSSTACALPAEGPFWNVAGSKLPPGRSKAVTGRLLTGTEAKGYGTIGTKGIRIDCKKGEVLRDDIYNGPQQGEGEAAVKANECTLFEEASSKYQEVKECVVSLTTAEGKGALWYRTTNGPKTERTATIQGYGLPGATLVFTKVTLSGEGCGVYEGTYKCEGSGAAEGRPQYTEAKKGILISPTETIHRLWRPTGSGKFTETKVEQIFNSKVARTEGEAEAELVDGEPAGVFEN